MTAVCGRGRDRTAAPAPLQASSRGTGPKPRPQHGEAHVNNPRYQMRMRPPMSIVTQAAQAMAGANAMVCPAWTLPRLPTKAEKERTWD